MSIFLETRSAPVVVNSVILMCCVDQNEEGDISSDELVRA